MMAFAPRTVQNMPDSLRRLPITVLQPASMTLSRRRDEWLTDLARRLHDLEGQVNSFHFDDLANNDQFVSATAQATQAALQTHNKEKLEALRNAVLNTALQREPDNDQQAVFLALIESSSSSSPELAAGAPQFGRTSTRV
jgi:hypothetical protein